MAAIRWCAVGSAGALVIAMAACGGEGKSSSCVPLLRWNGSTYFEDVVKAPRLGPRIGRATRPNCGARGSDERVFVRRISGVPPTVAVADERRQGKVALAEGYFVELPSHPLHVSVFGDARRRHPREQGRTCTVRAQVRVPPAVGRRFILTNASGETYVRLDTNTSVRGFLRDGLPFVRTGDFLVVRGHRCGRAGPGAVLTATRIEPQSY